MAYTGASPSIDYIGGVGPGSYYATPSVDAMQRSRKASGLGPQTGRVVPLNGPWNFYGITLKADLRQLNRIIMWVNSLHSLAMDPAVMGNAGYVLGVDYTNNFNTEGAWSGHPWQHLTEYTKRKRKERNFAEGPIMHQSGQLKELAAGALMNIHGRGSFSKTDRPYTNYPSDSRTTITVTLLPGQLNAKISGAKVQNQYGGIDSMAGYFGDFSGTGRFGAGYLPQRTFWYMNPALAHVVGDALVDRVMAEWMYADRNATRTGYMRMQNMQGVIQRRGR
jgi:hypothetical protein